MRRAVRLIPVLFALTACGATEDEQPAAQTPAASSSSSVAADASPSIAPFDIAAVCDQYCDFLDGVSTDPCSPDPYSYFLCAPLVDQVEGVLGLVTINTPPDVAYDDLQEASEQLQASINEYRSNDCATEQQGADAEICSANMSAVRFATDSVALRLRSAP